jgi:MinD-like ATPase involved in chromosome partitioning or flagellar assembly
MIRDLRSAQWRSATAPPSRSLAFAREDIERAGTVTAGPANARSDRALTIAVTAPRSITCKRGLAANLAVHLAAHVRAEVATGGAGEGSSVCVVDADLESRDIGTRFGITGPTLLDVANDINVREGRALLSDRIERVDPPGLHVLPTRLPQSALVPLLHSKTTALLASMRTAFDFVVIDAPVAVGLGAYDWERTLLGQVDILLVAVTAESSALGGVLRYLNALAAAKNSGALSPNFDAHVVLTGRDEDGTRSLFAERDIERKLSGIPVIASVPQLWGRQRPETPLDRDFHAGLHRDFAAIIDRVTEDQRQRRA